MSPLLEIPGGPSRRAGCTAAAAADFASSVAGSMTLGSGSSDMESSKPSAVPLCSKSLITRLNREIKRRADFVQTLAPRESVAQLDGAMMQGQDEFRPSGAVISVTA